MLSTSAPSPTMTIRSSRETPDPVGSARRCGFTRQRTATREPAGGETRVHGTRVAPCIPLERRPIVSAGCSNHGRRARAGRRKSGAAARLVPPRRRAHRDHSSRTARARIEETSSFPVIKLGHQAAPGSSLALTGAGSASTARTLLKKRCESFGENANAHQVRGDAGL
jgi:hypothetical protein